MLPDVKVELSQEQKEQLLAARKLIPEMERELRRAAQAGIDVADQIVDLAARKAELEKLYNVYVRKTAAPG